jgi:hypothetical protein
MFRALIILTLAVATGFIISSISTALETRREQECRDRCDPLKLSEYGATYDACMERCY